MYQDLLRKIAEEKPNYNQEEIQWLFDHLGNPSPEIRDDLILLRGFRKSYLYRSNFISLLKGFHLM
ncbi:aquaporin Z [Streptococcus pneumoniae]|nr:aquaporin Z [Streptococcus pneumoniae]